MSKGKGKGNEESRSVVDRFEEAVFKTLKRTHPLCPFSAQTTLAKPPLASSSPALSPPRSPSSATLIIDVLRDSVASLLPLHRPLLARRRHRPERRSASALLLRDSAAARLIYDYAAGLLIRDSSPLVSSSTTLPPLLIRDSAGARLVLDSVATRLIRDSTGAHLIHDSAASLIPLHTPLTHLHRRRPELHPGGLARRHSRLVECLMTRKLLRWTFKS
ncbi:hypothetical protein Scep_007776 [Stephania cephalantha]|uniref:Uncharacterized protein n=1 Tax=Stephania cephalantha TaxID=152367 RepID=A0AAP0PNK0_9MAGN